ncbi:MAG TPA: hypothetical protein VFH83_04350 [Spirochaetia bacterium]|nr:hypothetical protein [Spirochaetia bacterium]
MRTDILVSGSLVEPPFVKGLNPVVYDWARPDMFSKDQIWALSLLHERYAVSLGESLPVAPASCHVHAVDQQTFGELRASVGTGSACVAAQAEPGSTGVPAPDGRRFFAQSKDSAVVFGLKAAQRIERDARALEAASPFSVILFFAAMGGGFARLLSDATLFEGRFLPLLRDAWKQRVRMPGLVASPVGESGGKASGASDIPDSAMILLVQLEMSDTKELMTMVYPSDHLRKVLRFLS